MAEVKWIKVITDVFDDETNNMSLSKAVQSLTPEV